LRSNQRKNTPPILTSTPTFVNAPASKRAAVYPENFSPSTRRRFQIVNRTPLSKEAPSKKSTASVNNENHLIVAAWRRTLALLKFFCD